MGLRGVVPLVASSAAALVLLAGCSSDPDPGTSAASPTRGSSTPTASPSGPPYTGLFDVDGRELHLACTGTGSPTLVLEPGEGGTSDTLDAIRSSYDDRMTVCGYDRANVGGSGEAPTPRTSDDVTGDLHGLVHAAGVPGPYVLVGSSAGGLIVQAYAARYPDEVAGVVAMNPVPPWSDWSTDGFAEMTQAERRDETAYFEGQNGEAFDYVDMDERIAALPVPTVPFDLLVSTIAQCDSPQDICGRTYPASTRIMKALAARWPAGRFTQVPASHDIYVDDIEAVRAAVDDVLARAGAG